MLLALLLPDAVQYTKVGAAKDLVILSHAPHTVKPFAPGGVLQNF